MGRKALRTAMRGLFGQLRRNLSEGLRINRPIRLFVCGKYRRTQTRPRNECGEHGVNPGLPGRLCRRRNSGLRKPTELIPRRPERRLKLR